MLYLLDEKYTKILTAVKEDASYIKNVEYGKPRNGHPEGKVALHIEELERNLMKLNIKCFISPEYNFKILFLIHTHDTFKAEAVKNSPILDANSHSSLARSFAAKFIDDEDILNMIQYHDEGYALYRQVENKGKFNHDRLDNLFDLIKDWNLFLLFALVDNCTIGKDQSSVEWFISKVNEKFPDVWVDKTHMEYILES